MTRYSAFGLQIDSEIPLPELSAGSEGPADVTIRRGSVPGLSEPAGESRFHEASPGILVVKAPTVARYLVREAREIVVDAEPEASEDAVQLFLTGSAIGALLHQRKLLVLHAGAIQTDAGAVMFVGHSGHGKSTLMGALNRRGYPLLADDVTAVEVNPPSAPRAFSSIPRLRLRVDAASHLGYPVEELPRTDRTDKCLVRVNHFLTGSLPVHGIYSLNIHDEPTIRVEPLHDVTRFKLVADNTYRSRFLEGLGLRQMHFRAASEFARSVHIGKITRPSEPFLLDELVERLVEEFGPPVSEPSLIETPEEVVS